MAQWDADLARLADLSDDELTNLETQVTAAFQQADQNNDTQTMSDAADALDQIRTEKDRRAQSGGGGDGSGSAIPGTPDAAVVVSASAESPATPEPEPATAAGSPAVSTATATATDTATDTTTDTNAHEQGRKEPESVTDIAIPADRAPVVATAGPRIIAGADIPGVPAGTVLSDVSSVIAALTSRINTMRRLSGGDGEQVLVASVQALAPDERMLRMGDMEGNSSKIRDVTGLSAIVAAGGVCMPLTTRYDIFGLGDTARPVRDGLPGFQADRGGIRYFTGPKLSDVVPAVGVWACTDEGTAKTKPVLRAICPTEFDVCVGAFTVGLQFGVLSSRAFPEMVNNNNNLAMVAQARVAESNLLASIKAGSVAAASAAAKYGAVRDFLGTVSRFAAWFRDRNRLLPNTPLRVILPAWLLDAFRVDSQNGPPSTAVIEDNFNLDVSEITSFFTARGVNVTWALDSSDPTTNAGGFYADLAAGAIPGFPANVQWAIFPEGNWIHLDGGSLDLGIVRDSTLVRSNDYLQFAETFEAVANVGGVSYWVTTPLTTAGAYACCV